jgi:crossover junction endodeoxyribonuclease RuvC
MVTRLLRLDAPPKPADAADALALAICHIWRGPATDRLRQAVAAQNAAAATRTAPSAGTTAARAARSATARKRESAT